MRITLGAIKPLLALAGLVAAIQTPAVYAQSITLPLSVRDSFPLGTTGNVLCQVQSRAADAAILTFGEVFELKLDADIVILSACDTAGEADVRSTREAGIATGGGTALDGLARPFSGADGRAVLASHWPAPDDFNATARLITGLFSAGAGVSTGEALLAAERTLMADPLTSHPYDWAGFAVVGDATRPLVTNARQAAATAGAAALATGSR